MRRLSERKEVWAMQTEAVERVTVRNMFSKAGWSKQDHRGFGGFAVLFIFFLISFEQNVEMNGESV